MGEDHRRELAEAGYTVIAHMGKQGGLYLDPLAAWGEATGRLVYIGRAIPRLRLPASPYRNPFRHGTRAEVIAQFAASDWPREQALRELCECVLGCWCYPEDCHGRIIAEVVNQHLGWPA